jgi:hypothetical protein
MYVKDGAWREIEMRLRGNWSVVREKPRGVRRETEKGGRGLGD